MRDTVKRSYVLVVGESYSACLDSEFDSYKQYLQWIMGHAIVEYRLRVQPVWKRWKAWHEYHKKQVAILTIHYGHPNDPYYGVGYFFA